MKLRTFKVNPKEACLSRNVFQEMMRSVPHWRPILILVHDHIQPPVSAAADFPRPSAVEPLG